jgi:hypothetical protein
VELVEARAHAAWPGSPVAAGALNREQTLRDDWLVACSTAERTNQENTVADIVKKEMGSPIRFS